METTGISKIKEPKIKQTSTPLHECEKESSFPSLYVSAVKCLRKNNITVSSSNESSFVSIPRVKKKIEHERIYKKIAMHSAHVDSRKDLVGSTKSGTPININHVENLPKDLFNQLPHTEFLNFSKISGCSEDNVLFAKESSFTIKNKDISSNLESKSESESIENQVFCYSPKIAETVPRDNTSKLKNVPNSETYKRLRNNDASSSISSTPSLYEVYSTYETIDETDDDDGESSGKDPIIEDTTDKKLASMIHPSKRHGDGSGRNLTNIIPHEDTPSKSLPTKHLNPLRGVANNKVLPMKPNDSQSDMNFILVHSDEKGSNDNNFMRKNDIDSTLIKIIGPNDLGDDTVDCFEIRDDNFNMNLIPVTNKNVVNKYVKSPKTTENSTNQLNFDKGISASANINYSSTASNESSTIPSSKELFRKPLIVKRMKLSQKSIGKYYKENGKFQARDRVQLLKEMSAYPSTSTPLDSPEIVNQNLPSLFRHVSPVTQHDANLELQNDVADLPRHAECIRNNKLQNCVAGLTRLAEGDANFELGLPPPTDCVSNCELSNRVADLSPTLTEREANFELRNCVSNLPTLTNHDANYSEMQTAVTDLPYLTRTGRTCELQRHVVDDDLITGIKVTKTYGKAKISSEKKEDSKWNNFRKGSKWELCMKGYGEYESSIASDRSILYNTPQTLKNIAHDAAVDDIFKLRHKSSNREVNIKEKCKNGMHMPPKCKNKAQKYQKHKREKWLKSEKLQQLGRHLNEISGWSLCVEKEEKHRKFNFEEYFLYFCQQRRLRNN